MARDYYEVLGVPRDADDAAIKKAFRALARKYHPDVSKEADAEERFKEANEAHSVLSDPEKRKKYDRFGHQAFRAGGEGGPVDIPWEELMNMFGGGFGGAGGFGGGGRPGGFQFDFGGGGGGVEDLFGSFGGARRGRSRADAGRLESELAVDPTVAVQGGTRHIQLPPQAGGGSIELRIPAGSYDGRKMRLSGKGRPKADGSRGDMILTLRVKATKVFARHGDDLEVDLPISPVEAVRGAKLTVPAPDGAQALRVPPGVRSGQKLRLKGKGLPMASEKGKRRGDLYFRLNVVLPKELSDEQVEQLEAMEEGFDARDGLWGDLLDD